MHQYTVNTNPETGIRYGFISQHSLGDGADVAGNDWNNDSYDEYIKEAKRDFLNILQTAYSLNDLAASLKSAGSIPYRVADNAADLWADLLPIIESKAPDYPSLEDLETLWEDQEQNFADSYECNEDSYSFQDSEYTLQYSQFSGGTVIVERSPFFAYVRLCSPCAPNAGDLDTPTNDPETGYQAYCLGPDWFDSNDSTWQYARRLPYDIYSVETGELVQAAFNPDLSVTILEETESTAPIKTEDK